MFKKLITSLFFLTSLNAFAIGGGSGSIPTLTIGGYTFTSVPPILLFASNGASSNGTLRKQGTSAGYQVTAGKTLYIDAVQCQGDGTGGNVVFAQSDNDVGFSSATALTNPVYIYGTNGSIITLAANTTIERYLGGVFGIAATKFVSMSGSHIGCHVWGHEL